MKFLFLVSLVFFLGACAQKHSHGHNHEGGHDHAKMEQDKACGGCGHHDQAHGGGNCSDCKSGVKNRECCSDTKTCESKEAAAQCTAASMNAIPDFHNISKEEFVKTYTKKKDKIGPACSNPAMKYCDKSTKDLNVSESEFACLWSKVFRVTRERLPDLDGTPCAKMIKSFAK